MVACSRRHCTEQVTPMSSHGQEGNDPRDHLDRLPSHAQLDSTGIPRDRLGIPYRGVNNAGKGDIDSLLISNAMLLRQEILRKFLDPRRDIDDECGYPKGSLSPQFYQDLYDKDPIAQRVVQVYPRESWQVSPKVYEDPDGEATTPFELAFDAIGKKLLGERSYFLPSANGGSLIWEYLRRADELSGIGSFGIILIGMDDGKRLDEPAFKPDEPDGVGLYLQGTDKQYFRTASQAADDSWSPQDKGGGGNGTTKKESGPTAPGVKDKWSKALGNIGRKLPLGKGKPTGNAFSPKRVGPGEGVDDAEAASEPDQGADQGAAAAGPIPGAPGRAHGGEGLDQSGRGAEGDEDPGAPGDEGSGTDGGDAVDEPSPEDQEAAKKAACKLTFLRVFPESMVQVTQYESHLTSPRFGKPVMYLVTLNDPKQQNSGIGLPTMTVNVHWTRVIHLAEDLQSSETFGTPRMQPVLPRILDLRKLYGGSAEMYWRGAFPGHSFESVPELGGDVKFDPQAMRNAYEEYSNGLQRAMFLAGFTMKSQAPQVVDPASQINVQLEAIGIKLGMPVRILKGSERGELASSQDDAAWNDRLRFRQLGYLTPRVIVPLIDRLITLGVLPAPEVGPDGEAKKGKVIVNRSVLVRNAETGEVQRVKATPLEMDLDVGYSVEWPDLDSLGDTDRANLGLVNTQALTAYIAGNGQAAVPVHDFLTSKKFLGMEDEEATAMLDKVEEDAKAQEANDQFLAAQGEGRGAMMVGPDGQPLPPEQGGPQPQLGPDGKPLPPGPDSPLGAPPKPGAPPSLQRPAGPPTPPPVGTPRPPGGLSPSSSQPPPAAPPAKGKPPFARNTFCPTGKGGGVDPSCSPKGYDADSHGPLYKEGSRHRSDSGTIVEVHRSQYDHPDHGPRMSYRLVNKDTGKAYGTPKGIHPDDFRASFATPMTPEDAPKYPAEPKKPKVFSKEVHAATTAAADATAKIDARAMFSANRPAAAKRAVEASRRGDHAEAEREHSVAASFHEKRASGEIGDGKTRKPLSSGQKKLHKEAGKAHREAAGLHHDMGLDTGQINNSLSDNTFCATGKGGGVDATCGKDGGGKGSGGEATGSKGRLAAMFPKTTAAVESIKGAAKAVGQGVWSKLPGPVKVSLSAVYSAAKFVEHGLEAAYHSGQKAAVAVAKERGYTDEQAAKLGKVLGTLDGVARWTTNIPVAHHALEALAHVGGWTGFGAAKVGFYVPVASLAYVAQSTLRNPFATIRAARKAVQSAMGNIGRELPLGKSSHASGLASVEEITPASPKESATRSAPEVKAIDKEKAPRLSVRPLSRNELATNQWVTLEGGQHVWIGEDGKASYSGPPDKEPSPEPAAKSEYESFKGSSKTKEGGYSASEKINYDLVSKGIDKIGPVTKVDIGSVRPTERWDKPVERQDPEEHKYQKEESKEKISYLQELMKQGKGIPAVLVRKTGENKYDVIDGHHRLEAAQREGYAQVPIRVVEDRPASSRNQLSHNEIVGNAGHWVTLGGGQHVFISDKGTLHPGGPGTPAVSKDSLGESSKAVESAPKYTTVAGWTYKNGVAVPKEEHQAYKKGELGKPIGDAPKSSEPPPGKTKPGDKLDAQEKDAIQSWSMGGYEYMHAHERGEPGSSLAQYAKTLNSALDKMPFHKGELYRGAGLTAAELKDYKVGATITAKTTDSYSLSRETAVNVFLNPKIEDSARAKGRTPVLIKIDNPKTARSVSGNVISIAEKEGEAIARKGAQYKVKKVIDKGTHKEIHLSELGTNNSLNQLARAQHLILNASSSPPENQDPYDMVHQMTLNVSKAEQGLIADALEAHDFDDWYIALLYGAMDEAGGKTREAIGAADAAYELNPTPPRGVDLETPQDDDEEDDSDDDEEEAAGLEEGEPDESGMGEEGAEDDYD